METKFGSWSVAESPLTVEYSLLAIEEVRQAVTEGFQRLSRGGMEVGGVLFGRREGDTVRILAIRPIECEHAHGPAFILSERDKEGLRALLNSAAGDPLLHGMSPAGWFLSHTRTEISMNETDVAVFKEFFPEPWQVTLVVRPGRHGAMRAGFFLREPDGTLRAERSYLDFNLPDRVMAFERISVRGRGPAERRPFVAPPPQPVEPAATEIPEVRTQRPESRPPVAPRPILPPDAPRFLTPAAPAPSRKWLWLAVWGVLVIAIAGGGATWYYQSAMSTPEPISLHVLEREGQLQIEWNHSAGPVARAARGALEVIDGGNSRTIALTREDLVRGNFTYVRSSGDVEVRMVVTSPDGVQTRESSRFLGRPAGGVSAAGGEPAGIRAERDRLQLEVDRLQRSNDQQNARIQQLERTIRILESRLNIDRGKQ